MYKVEKQTRPVFEVKDGEGSIQTNEPDVTKAVIAEVKALGENSKKLYDGLQTEVKQLQDALKGVQDTTKGLDALTAAKVSKLSEAIITKQEALDKKTQELELAFKRGNMNSASADISATDRKAAREFFTGVLASRGTLPKYALPDSAMDMEGFKGYGDAFSKWMRVPDSRLLSDSEHKDMMVGSDPDGGYFVTPAISARVTERIWESDPLRALATVETITTDSLEIPLDDDEASAGWVGETESRTTTGTPQVAMNRIPVHEMYAAPRATQKLLEDAGINVEAWLANKIGSKFARIEGAAFVSGTGVKQPRGFLTYSNWTTAGVYERGKVEQVNMGAAAALTSDGLVKVKFALVEEHMGRATWLMNRLAVRDAMLLKDGDGQYLWRAGLEPGAPSILLGLPVRMSTTMPVVAANALSVALADWREAYTIVDRLGITVLRDPYTQVPFVKFYTRKRVGGDVVNVQAIKIGKVAA